MNAPINLQCRPELLQQWQGDVEKNPQAFAAVLALSPEFVAMLVHDATAAAWLLASSSAALDVRAPAPIVREAFEIADEAMFEFLESEGVPWDEHRTAIGFTHEGGEEVKSLAEASQGMQQAVDWLKRRGYVELGNDKMGEFALVIRRPEDEDGFVGVPEEVLGPGAPLPLERAADFLQQYADFIRRDVMSVDIERHPYLPELEEVAQEIRAAAGGVAAASAGTMTTRTDADGTRHVRGVLESGVEYTAVHHSAEAVERFRRAAAPSVKEVDRG